MNATCTRKECESRSRIYIRFLLIQFLSFSFQIMEVKTRILVKSVFRGFLHILVKLSKGRSLREFTTRIKESFDNLFASGRTIIQ